MGLLDRIEAALGRRPTALQPVSGGCINEAHRADLPDGTSVFVKTHPHADPAMFPAEAAGLRALAVAGVRAPPVPAVLHVDPTMLVLQWLPPDRLGGRAWEELGRGLAALHRCTPSRPAHGFDVDNFIGATAQPNPWTQDGVVFFAEHRLRFQLRLAVDRGRMSKADASAGDRVIDRLPGLLSACAQEPPALLHGDLWGGNVHASAGKAWLIDPATHYGLREADLAMTRLFGALPGAFYGSYEEAWPLPPGAPGRVDLFNLYHLLNHLNLFGGTYLGQVRSSLARYG